MIARFLTAVFLALLLGSGSALAAEGKVTISSPANGATFAPTAEVVLTYEAVPGAGGDHLHLNLDGKLVDIVRPLKGSASVGTLAPGQHHICLAINSKAHVPTGVEGCIDVTSK